jgi:hypothetical protein
MTSTLILPQAGGKNQEYSPFEGTSIFNVIGMYYLSHLPSKDVCVINGEPYEPDEDIKHDDRHHHTKSCVKLPHNSLYNIPGAQTSVSLRWIEKNGSISVPTPHADFWNRFSNCEGYDIIALPFGFNCLKFGHANYLLLNTKKTPPTLERFESFGRPSGSCIGNDDVDTKIEDLFKTNFAIYAPHLKDFDYIRPKEYLPYQNVQSIQENEDRWKNRDEEKNPVGFCSVWSLWYIELRISNPDKDPDDLIEEAIDAIRKVEDKRRSEGYGEGSFTDFIRRYSLKIVDLHKRIDKVYSDSSSSRQRGSYFSDGKRSGKKKKTLMSPKKTSQRKRRSPKKFNLQIFDTQRKGKGVKTQSFIKKGTVIIEYGNKRYGADYPTECKKCDNNRWFCSKHNRLMRLPDNTWLDCDSKCISGYINHSQTKANCKTVSVKKNNKIHVYIQAIKDIQPDTELLYNYYS